MDIVSFESSLQSWGYLLLFFASFGGGYIPIVVAGIVSGSGTLNITTSIIVASLGNFFGSSLTAYLIRSIQKDQSFLASYLKKHRRKITLISLYLRRYGIWLVFLCKFIYGLKTILPITIGIGKFPLKKFFLYNFFASIFFSACIGTISYFASAKVRDFFLQIDKDFTWKLGIFLAVVLIAIFFTLHLITRRKG